MTIRTLTLVVTYLCTVPLFWLAGALLVVSPIKNFGSDQTIGYAYLGFLVGCLFAAAGVYLIRWLFRHYVTPDNLRYVQIADAVALVAVVVLLLLFW